MSAGAQAAALPDAQVERGGPRYALLAGEHALWLRWREAGDAQAREKIVHHYLAYARALAARIYARRSHNEFEFDEYMQLATVGLIESVDRFDPSRGVLFKTFATRRIAGSVLSGLRTLSERQQQIALRRRVAQERLESLRSQPLAEVDPEDALRALTEIGVGIALGLLLEGTGMISDGEPSLPDNTYSGLELRQLRERVAAAVGELTAREQDVIRRHYLQGIAFDEIARELDITKGRVSQLHRQGLERLRALIADRGAGDFTL
jgi:RNA polymerase sigma factor for flagellar operon FliA